MSQPATFPRQEAWRTPLGSRRATVSSARPKRPMDTCSASPAKRTGAEGGRLPTGETSTQPAAGAGTETKTSSSVHQAAGRRPAPATGVGEFLRGP
jgi:hypothetical protein